MTHGFFSKFLPEEALEIMEAIEERSPGDLIYDQIQILYAAIIRARKIMFVRNQDDTTRELIRTKESYSKNCSSSEEEYKLQLG
ncbi:hypothetical protein ACFDTO_13450 [Microbacteriaceae bacterium 4G12]